MCGMNSIRSPMAEAIARHYLPQSVYVASAGVRRGERDPFVDACSMRSAFRSAATSRICSMISRTTIST
jgi:protein-tyrosine-phosphatase